MDVAKMLVNLHPEPLPGYKFKVYIQGVSLGFSKVTNLEESIETEPLQEGGVNDRVYSLLRPVSTERTLVMERGMAGRGGATRLLTRQLAAGRRITTDIIITVNDRSGKIATVFLVQGAVVRKVSYGDLDSMSGQLLITRFELTYEIMENYTLPVPIPDVFL